MLGPVVQPESAADALHELEDLGSPIAAFVRDRCRLGPYEDPIDALYDQWRAWCSDNGRPTRYEADLRPDLRAAVPGLSTRQPRDDERRSATTSGSGSVLSTTASHAFHCIPHDVWHTLAHVFRVAVGSPSTDWNPDRGARMRVGS